MPRRTGGCRDLDRPEGAPPTGAGAPDDQLPAASPQTVSTITAATW